MNRSHRLSIVAAAASLSLGGAAIAQDKAATATPDGKPAIDLTCAELSTLDTATVPGVLYFVAGYKEGERKAAEAGSPAADNAASDASDQEASSGDDEGSSETSADTADTSSDTSGSDMQIGRISGYFNIPVEDVVVACDADPARNLGDILDEKAGQQGDSDTETDSGESSSSSN